MGDVLVASYLAVIGALEGCVLLKILTKAAFNFIMGLFLLDVLVFSLAMPVIVNGAWSEGMILLAVFLPFTYAFVLYFLSDLGNMKIPFEDAEDRWRNKLKFVAVVFAFSLFFAGKISEMTLMVQKNMPEEKLVSMLFEYGIYSIGTSIPWIIFRDVDWAKK